MADGDSSAGTAASAIGLAVMTGIETVATAWRYVNSTRDMIANHITSGTHAVGAITGVTKAYLMGIISTVDASQLTGVTKAYLMGIINTIDASQLTGVTKAYLMGIISTVDVGQLTGLTKAYVLGVVGSGVVTNASDGTNTLALKWSGTNPQIKVDGTLIDLREYTDGNFGSNPIFSPYARANAVSTSYVAAYINSDGRIGATPSSRRFKNHLHDYEVPAGFWDLKPVVFSMKDDPNGVPRVGFYAEDTNEVEPLLVVHEDGKPFSVRYETWAAALHAATHQRVLALEARVRELEGHNA